MKVDKLEFYRKLEKKITIIKTGELDINDYHSEIREKILSMEDWEKDVQKMRNR